MKKPKNYALDLAPAEAKTQRELRKKIAALGNGKPLSLEEVRERAGLTYDQLAVAIDALDRSHAFRLCKFERQPDYAYAKHIEKMLKGVVSVDRIMSRG